MNIKRNIIALSLLLGALGGATVAQAATHHHPDYAKGSKAYGYAGEGGGLWAAHGNYINGNFIPQGTSPAQVPSHHEEDFYCSEAGKN
jgi:hypothetical protein